MPEGFCPRAARHRACGLVIVLALSVYACDRPPPEPGSFDVTVRDSAGIRIVENHAPVWASADFWIVNPEPEFVLGHGAPGDSAHLVWNIRQAGVLSNGRVAMLSPGGDRKVLVFEPSGRLSAAFGRAGRGPGEFYRPSRLQVLPGDTIVVWDQGFGPVYHFDPSGKILRERRIDLGAVGGNAFPYRIGPFRPRCRFREDPWQPPAETRWRSM